MNDIGLHPNSLDGCRIEKRMRNPLADRYRRKLEQTRNTLTAKEQDSLSRLLIADASTRAMLVELYLRTGCRNSEGRVIRRLNLNTERLSVVFETLKQRAPLGEVIREVPIPYRLFCKLYDLPGTDSQRFWPIGRHTARRWTRNYMLKAGIPPHLCHPHALRHNANVRLIKGGADKRIRDYFQGHKPTGKGSSTNDIYGAMSADEMERNAVLQEHPKMREYAMIMGGWRDD